MKYLFLLITSLFLHACSSSTCDDEQFELIGTWELVGACASPGDASCPIQTPTEDRIVEFRADSTFTFTMGNTTSNGTFTESDGFIDFINDGGEIIFSRFIREANACELELSPFCIEECRELYEKID